MTRSAFATSGQRQPLSAARRSLILLPLAPNHCHHRHIERVRSPDTLAEDPLHAASCDRTLGLWFCRAATAEFPERVFRNRARRQLAILLRAGARDCRRT